jgi:hypothetical protein
MSVKLVRLMSGEELLATVIDSQNEYHLKNVVQVITSVAQDKKLKVSFIPFMPIANTDNGVTVNKSFCAILIDPVDSVLESYKLLWQEDNVEPAQQSTPEPQNVQMEIQTNDLVPKRKGQKAKAATVKPNVAFVKG